MLNFWLLVVVEYCRMLLLLLLLLGDLKLQVDVVLNAGGWLLVVVLFVIGGLTLIHSLCWDCILPNGFTKCR